jgi:transposase
MRARLRREDFQRFWKYRLPTWAARFLWEWTARVKRSRLGPMKKVARMFERHGALLMNWFMAKGTMPSRGLNYNVKLTVRKSFGFCTLGALQATLYHRLGTLPNRNMRIDSGDEAFFRLILIILPT